MKDVVRTRKLAIAQESLIHASKRLHEIDLRKVPLEQRELIKRAIQDTKEASESVDAAFQHDVQ